MSGRQHGWTAADMPDQSGRTAVVTGANSGLGLRSAEALARAGARVLIACRNPEKGKEALGRVRQAARADEPVLLALDLSDLMSVRSCAKELADTVERLDIVMNNAGVMALPLRRNDEGWEMQFATNHLGHFAFDGLVLPLLLRADAPRVVTTSSQAHRIGRVRWDDLQWERTYRKWSAYGQSKLANLLFAFELDRRARQAGANLVSAAAHPGYAATHLQAAGPELAGSSVMLRLNALANRLVSQSDEMGALPQLYAATVPDVRGGDYYGPDGAFERVGHPTKVKAARAACREADAARLWDLSERLTGVSFDFAAAG